MSNQAVPKHSDILPILSAIHERCTAGGMPWQPVELGIVLGSGLGALADKV